jgi:hypothetical protein
MNTQITETKPSPETVKNFILEVEALRNKAESLNIPMVIGVDEDNRTYITAFTPLRTSDNIFLIVTGLAPRLHPSVLTLSQLNDVMQRLEDDTEDLRASGIPFVVGVQPEYHGKLRILSHMPNGTQSSLHSAHLDLTMFGDTQDVPCS